MILGYSNKWVAQYVSLFQDSSFKIDGDIRKYEHDCKKKSEKSYCTNRYIIPYEKIKNHSAVGVGVIISSSIFYCKNNRKKTVEFDNVHNPGQRFDLMNIYQVISLKNLSCKSDLIIESWSKYGSVRYGYQDGSLSFGSLDQVNRVKTLFEFFSKELHRIIAFSLLLSLLLHLLLISIMGTNILEDNFSSSITTWFFFLFTASDLFHTIFPLSNYPFIINKIVAVFSLAAHSLPIINFFNKKSNKKIRPKYMSTGLCYFIATLGIFSDYWLLFFYTSFFTCSLLYLLISLKHKNHLFFCFSIICFFVGLKMKNYPYMPSSMSTSIFLGLYFFQHLFNRVNATAKISKAILNTSPERSDGVNFKKSNEESVFKHFPAKKITFLNLMDNDGCRIEIYEMNNKSLSCSTIVRETLPPIFAYVISSGKPLWHEHEDSELMKLIQNKDTKKIKYSGKYLTIIPIIQNNRTYGAIAFTNYPSHLVNDKEKENDIKRFLNLYMPIYSNIISEINLKSSKKTSKKIFDLEYKIDQLISETDLSENEELIYPRMLKLINNELSSYGYLGQLDIATRKLNILDANTYPSLEVQNKILSGSIFANKDNKHGPVPVSINESRIVIIDDIRLWKGVLHEFTVYFFNQCKTKSCVSIPIYDLADDRKACWGVLFLERSINEPFNNEQLQIFEFLSSKISKIVKSICDKNEKVKTVEALKKFIPEYAVSEVVNNGSFETDDQGYLLMIDLKSSTKISNSLGKKTWSSATNEILKEIKKFDNIYGFQLVEFKWDAFYFTKKVSNSPSELRSIYNLISFLKPIVDSVYKKYFKVFANFQLPNTNKLRACLVYGDISRGLTDGPQKIWTFIGNEMANVTKLEDTCKSLMEENPYQFFFIDSSIIQDSDNLWEKTNKIVESNDRKIFAHKRSWSNFLKEESKDKAA